MSELDPLAELEALRLRIDDIDESIVGQLNERARLALEAGRLKVAAGWGAVRDDEREREVLLRVAMANQGPLPQSELLEIYRRVIDAFVALEERDQGRQR